MNKNIIKKNIVAVDIGTESIKALVGQLAADGSLVINNSGFVPSKGYAGGEIEDASELATTIKQLLDGVISSESGQAEAEIYLGIGATFIQGQTGVGNIAPAAPDQVTQSDIDRACRAAIFAAVSEEDEVLHVFALDNVSSLNGESEKMSQLLKEGGGLKIAAHIVTTPKQVIESITEELEALGIAVSGIVSNNIVTAQAIMPNWEKGASEPISLPIRGILLDIGAGTVNIAFFSAGSIRYSASLPLGGNYITSDIMKGIEVSFVHAEAIKRYYAKVNGDFYGQKITLDCNDFGTTDKFISYDFLYDIVESRLDEIVYLTHQYLKPKLDEYLQDSPDVKLMLTGGAVLLPSLVNKLAKTFETEAEVIDFEKLAPEYNSPVNAACYGILCHAANQIRLRDISPETNPAAVTSDSNTAGSWQLFKRNFKKIFKL